MPSDPSMQAIMTRDVVAVAPDTPLREVLERMAAVTISCVVVCEDGCPVGIISERDVVRLTASWAEGQPGATTGADIMSTPVTTIADGAALEEAVARARGAQIRRLPVVDAGGALIGIVTQTDILAAFARRMEARVAERTAALSAANERLEALSREDGLLGIGNRRAMNEALDQVHGVALRYGRPWAAILADIDHFKSYNDTYGHLAGDSALRQVSDCLAETLRGPDCVFRYGGEEFLVLLPETGLAEAVAVAERLALGVRNLRIEHSTVESGSLTASFGVAAEVPGEQIGGDYRSTLQVADHALYRAKEAGRDRVESAES